MPSVGRFRHYFAAAAPLACLLFGTAPAQGQTATATPVEKPVEANKKTEDEEKDQQDVITVIGTRPAIRRTVDGTIYDTRDNPQAQAGSVADVLATIPSVGVSGDGNISVRGSGNVQIYIDGRPTGTQPENRAATLQAMAGSSIAAVEVITAPSAQFDANGGTVINLILKKEPTEGFGGNLIVNAGDRGRKNAAFNGSYTSGAMSVRLNLSLRDDVRLTRTFGDRLLRGEDGSILGRSLREARYTPTHSRSANIDGSLSYALSGTSAVGLDVKILHGSPTNRVSEYHADYDPHGVIVQNYQRSRAGEYFNSAQDASIYFQRGGAKDQARLKLMAQTSRKLTESDRPFLTSYAIPQIAPVGERIVNRHLVREHRLALDYERPLSKALTMSGGLEWKRNIVRQDNGRSLFDPSLAILPAPGAGYIFDGRQTSLAAYLVLRAQFGMWTVQAGTRGQSVTIDTRLLPETAVPRRRISNMNHDLAIHRELGAGRLSVKFNRALQFFDLRDLNPLVTYIDATSRTIGSPTLRPQTITALEAGYSLTKGGFDVSLSFYHRRTNDNLVDYPAFLPNNISVGAKLNAGTAKAHGLEASISSPLTATLKYSFSANFFHSSLPLLEDLGVGQANQKTSYAVKIALDWKPTKADNIRVDAQFQGPTLVPQGVQLGSRSLGIIWRRTLTPDLVVSVTGQNLLQKKYMVTRVDTATALDITRALNGRRAIWLGLIYKIPRN